MGVSYGDLTHACARSVAELKNFGEEVDTGHWQGIDTEGKPDLVTREVLDLSFKAPLERGEWHNGNISDYFHRLAVETRCNEEWAAEHFAERVGGRPLNPDPSHVRWPWWRGQDDATKKAGEFTHTYSERFWPRIEGRDPRPRPFGVRFQYGDYNDVLDLLARNPYTRQAYLPIFFPEDTGAVHQGRIPCSLGYHFLLRGNRLHCWYDIRSCDAVRHFRDDLYLAACLVGHTVVQLANRSKDWIAAPKSAQSVWEDVVPGTLHFKAHSFHVHMGDYHLL